jgi:hypothetical protein
MVEQGATQQGLSCPHLAGDGDEALAFFNPLEQVSERFLMGLTAEQKAGVGGDTKRVLVEAEK